MSIKFYDIENFYHIDEKYSYCYTTSHAPFDGKQYLIKTNRGIVEAGWDEGYETDDPVNGKDYSGWCWVCYDSDFQIDFEDAKFFAFIDNEPADFQEFIKTIRYDKDSLINRKPLSPEDFFVDEILPINNPLKD